MPPVVATPPPETAVKALESAGWKVAGQQALNWYLSRNGTYLVVPKRGAILDWDVLSHILDTADLSYEEFRELVRDTGYTGL